MPGALDYALALFTIIAFTRLMRHLKFREFCLDVVDTARQSGRVLMDPAASDEIKEKSSRQAAVKLAILAGRLLLTMSAAAVLVALPAALAVYAGKTTQNALLDALLSWPILLLATAMFVWEMAAAR